MGQSDLLITTQKKGWGKLGGTSSNEKEFSPKMDVTYSCFVHHILAKKEEGLLI